MPYKYRETWDWGLQSVSSKPRVGFFFFLSLKCLKHAFLFKLHDTNSATSYSTITKHIETRTRTHFPIRTHSECSCW